MFFVQGPKDDIYYGDSSPDGSKTSIHSSGVAHMKTGKHFIPLGKGKPLSEFKGLRQLFVMSIGNLVFSSPYFGKKYKGKKVDGFVLFDIRKFKSDIGLRAFLLEPAHADELNKLLKILDEPQFSVFTETKPWLVIAIHNNAPSKIGGAAA